MLGRMELPPDTELGLVYRGLWPVLPLVLRPTEGWRPADGCAPGIPWRGVDTGDVAFTIGCSVPGKYDPFVGPLLLRSSIGMRLAPIAGDGGAKVRGASGEATAMTTLEPIWLDEIDEPAP